MKEPMKTETKPGRHDEAVRQQAVRMWKQSEKSAELTSRELGISVFQLYDWNRTGLAGERAVAARAGEDHRAEGHPRKAAGILSEPSHSGMPGLAR